MEFGSENITKNHLLEPEFLLNVLDNHCDVVMILNRDTEIIFINKAYTKMLGVPKEKVLGRRLIDIEPDAGAVQVIKTGVQQINRHDYLKSISLEVFGTCVPLKDSHENVIGCFAIFYNHDKIVEITEKLKNSRNMIDYLQQELDKRDNLPKSFEEYIGQNKSLKNSLEIAAKAAKTDLSILIQGESGVGKEVLARAIYRSGCRSDKQFIKINCAAIPDTLMDSEMFGYEQGSFTGARKEGMKGIFEMANGGTLFLDEIGDMNLWLQAKILRVIQEKEIMRIGGTKTIPVDVRIISSTNRDLLKMVKDESFRLDLYYRLNVVPVTLPPLRERKDDIMTLSGHFIEKFQSVNAEKIKLSNQVFNVLYEYQWPGNIRELQNVLEYANMMRSKDTIEVQHLPEYLIPKDYFKEQPDMTGLDLKSAMNIYEKKLILSTLQKNADNRTAAMEELGISRRAFYEKLAKHGIGLQSRE